MMKPAFLHTVAVAVIALAGCRHPAPGEPGNRQCYRPLMQHLHRTNPAVLAGFAELKTSDPTAYRKRLEELNAAFGPAVVRAKDADGTFTCACGACQKTGKKHGAAR